MQFQNSISKIIHFFSKVSGASEDRIRELIKFCIVGGSGVVINMGLLYVFTQTAQLKIEFASPLAIESSMLSNFFFNNLWTFRRRDISESILVRLLKFHLVTGLAGIANYVVLLGLVNFTGMDKFLANFIGITVGFIINYSLNSRWTWKKEKPNKLPGNDNT